MEPKNCVPWGGGVDRVVSIPLLLFLCLLLCLFLSFLSLVCFSLSFASRSLRSLPSSPPPFSSKILIKAPACRVLPRPRLEPRDNELRRLDESLGALGHAGLLFRGKGASRRPGEAGVPADVGDAGDGLLDLEGSFFRFAGSGLRKGGGRG